MSSFRRYRSISTSLSLLLILAVASWQSAFGQTVNATLTGHVEDSQGAVIAGASVTVKNTGTGAVRTVVTDGSGLYTVGNLQPGAYEVTTSMSGFSTKTLTGLTLNVGDTQELPISMAIGGANDTVNVEAAEPLLQTQTSSNSTLVDNKQVVELPLSNRQFYSLALLSPAAYQPAQNSTLGFRGGINIAGASEISNQFTFNGIYNNDMGVAQPSYRPSVETIQEFRLLTGVYSAEYGRMAGGQVVVISKSGTNAFHGSAYEFIRNEIFAAKPYFNPAGSKTPSFKQNTFGGTIGGPIWKDHTFFFFGYEGQRIRRAQVLQSTIPTTGMLNGIFTKSKSSATNQLYDPATGLPLTDLTPGNGSVYTYNLSTQLSGTGLYRWSSVGAVAGQTIAKLGFPASNSSLYTLQRTRQEDMNEYTVRIDHRFSDKDSINGSFNIFKDPAFEPSNSLCGTATLPKFGCFTNQISTLINVTYDRVITPTLLNEFRAGYQRLQQPRIQEDNTAIGSTYTGLPGGPYFTQANYPNNLGLPQTSVNGYATVGGATNLPQNRWDSHYQLVDTVTWTKGKHNIKGGADFLLARSVNLITSSGRGSITINDGNLRNLSTGIPGPIIGSSNDSLADLLLGIASSTGIAPTAPIVYLNFLGSHFFVQDDWKIAPNLTINAGIRYEMDSPVYSPSFTTSKLDVSAQTYIVSGPNTYKNLYNYDYNNWAPRLGFSWQPLKGGNTVIKGAAGVFYNTPLLYNQFLNFGTGYPFRNNVTYNSTRTNVINLSNPFPSGASGPSPCITKQTVGQALNNCAAAFSPQSVNQNYRTPYLTEWSFGIQQQITKNIVLESTYFGSKGTKLPLSINLNAINPATYVKTTAPAQTDRPFPGYSTVSNQDTRSNSQFHSWQNSLKQSYTNGLTFILSYTWGKSIDGGGGIGSGSNSSGGAQNIYNLRAERGLSDFNVAHRLSFSPVYALPFGKGKTYLTSGIGSAVFGGWQVSGIFQFQTGRPFTVTNSTSNRSGYFGGADRPDLVTGQDPNAGPKTVTQWFNTAAYTQNPTFTAHRFGTAGRNQVIGPKLTQLDLTLSRSFPIFEKLSGQFRAESFNILNHPNFFNPYSNSTAFGTAAFGSITNAYDPRDLQFSLRLLF